MHLTLLRHSKVEPRYEGCFNGWSDVGIDKSFSVKNTKEILKSKEFDKIYSSTLKRTYETLLLLGYDRFIKDSRIKEVRFSNLVEGKRFEEFKEVVPKRAFEDKKAWIEFLCQESMSEFRERVESFLKDLEGKHILVCSHSGTIKMIESIILKKDFEDIVFEKIDYLEVRELEYHPHS